MGKLQLFCVLVILVITSCVSNVSGSGENPEEPQNEIIYEIDGDSLIGKLPDNSPWNYQGLFSLGRDVSFSSGDKLSLEIRGVSDIDISLLQGFFVDTVDGSGWKVLSGYYKLCEEIVAGKEFIVQTEVRISKSSQGDNIFLALYSDYDSAESEAILNLSQLTVIKLVK